MSNYSSYIVIQTYNEGENIEKLIREINFNAPDVNILIIDDNSADNTGKIVESLRKEFKTQGIIHRPYKMGLGSAYVLGFSYAVEHGADFIVTMDADFCHLPETILKLIDSSNTYDVVIGSRYLSVGKIINWGCFRKIISFAANLTARKLLLLKVNDCTSGSRFYNKRVFQTLDLNETKSNGYSFLIKMIFYCSYNNLKIKKLPITFVNRSMERSNILRKEIFKVINTLCRLSLLKIMKRFAVG